MWNGFDWNSDSFFFKILMSECQKSYQNYVFPTKFCPNFNFSQHFFQIRCPTLKPSPRAVPPWTKSTPPTPLSSRKKSKKHQQTKEKDWGQGGSNEQKARSRNTIRKGARKQRQLKKGRNKIPHTKMDKKQIPNQSNKKPSQSSY